MGLTYGDYTALAGEYARHRVGYAPGVPRALLARARGRGAPACADLGAGTGIWTRMLAAEGAAVVAVEPSDAMRARARTVPGEHPIDWRRGTAEATGLPDASLDLVTMASAFHWTDFERAVAEIARILRPGGWFAALWNTRVIDGALLREVEAELRRRVPGYRPRSSGRSAFCEGLAARLAGCGRFAAVETFEERHVERLSPERYLGIWRSVNDARVQAGEQAFAGFLRWVEERTRGLGTIEAPYRTRVWAARTPGGRG